MFSLLWNFIFRLPTVTRKGISSIFIQRQYGQIAVDVWCWHVICTADTEGTKRTSGDANYVDATQSGCVCIFDAVQLFFRRAVSKELGDSSSEDSVREYAWFLVDSYQNWNFCQIPKIPKPERSAHLSSKFTVKLQNQMRCVTTLVSILALFVIVATSETEGKATHVLCRTEHEIADFHFCRECILKITGSTQNVSDICINHFVFTLGTLNLIKSWQKLRKISAKCLLKRFSNFSRFGLGIKS